MAFVPLTVAVLVTPFAGEFPGRSFRFGLALLAEGGLLAALYASGRYTRWLVATAAKPDAQPGPPESEKPLPG